MDTLLNVDQAAQLLGVRPGYLRRLVRERRLPYVRIGKFLRFEPAELVAWVQAGRVEQLE